MGVWADLESGEVVEFAYDQHRAMDTAICTDLGAESA
jgi:hypothetical protein